jgi:endogenous inhibitor of DNA gyrase (YacG/DUF329 family)
MTTTETPRVCPQCGKSTSPPLTTWRTESLPHQSFCSLWCLDRAIDLDRVARGLRPGPAVPPVTDGDS